MNVVVWLIFVTFAFLLGGFIGSQFPSKYRNHIDGTLVVMEDDASKIYQLEIATPPDKLSEQKTLTMEIKKISSISKPNGANDNPEDIPPEWAGM